MALPQAHTIGTSATGASLLGTAGVTWRWLDPDNAVHIEPDDDRGTNGSAADASSGWGAACSDCPSVSSSAGSGMIPISSSQRTTLLALRFHEEAVDSSSETELLAIEQFEGGRLEKAAGKLVPVLLLLEKAKQRTGKYAVPKLKLFRLFQHNTDTHFNN